MSQLVITGSAAVNRPIGDNQHDKHKHALTLCDNQQETEAYKTHLNK